MCRALSVLQARNAGESDELAVETVKRIKPMFMRSIILSLAALFAAGLMAETASADQARKPKHILTEEDPDPGPRLFRIIPGLRIFFGDYTLSEEEFDELYGDPSRARHDSALDEEPDMVPPRRKAMQGDQQEPLKKKAAAKPGEPKKPAGKATANKAQDGKAPAGLSCEKAGSVVSGYGFSQVTPSSCSGKVYAFNATRDGKSFAIKLDPRSGALTDVKKLP
jgi:hypothetical protein